MALPYSAFRTPHSTLSSVLCLLSSVLSAASPCLAQDDPFAAGVRTTPWLKPEDEQKAFNLPPGFEIQLVAAEPDIQKPLNMAFDERGRIWLTCSVEYPYAAPLDKPGRDSIRVLEDTNGDGGYEKVTVFADGLNIPIGIYPYKGGCIAWSIPNIWHFEDTDGDGACDKRTVLYGPFDHTRDVHGNCNAFRRGFDGWVYACHGFNNDSHVKGRDGHEVHLNSGNTFRFKLDGSRIEHFTHGQVNPFGMCFDELFNIFTADCHSKPLTQLIRGGYYPSFGKPHDGLGFVPSMMEHLHGSTAICGVVKYSGENFPKEYHGHFLSGNVMTSRINRNKPEYHGSTIKAIEQPDFLSTTDPWFRPVDLQVGPDGALYILDFYNRIIGHYEVPLPHPGRDRTSGRIWRVVYSGNQASGTGGRESALKLGRIDLTKLSIEQLIAELDSSQLEHRLRALNYLVDTKAGEAVESFAAVKSGTSLQQRIAALWALERLMPPPVIDELGDGDRSVRVHALKAFSARSEGNQYEITTLLKLAGDGDAFVARAGAQAIGEHPSGAIGLGLLSSYLAGPENDVLLKYAQRQAIRNNLAVIEIDDDSQTLDLNPEALDVLAPIAAATPTPYAASLLIRHISRAKQVDPTYVQYAARYALGSDVTKLIRVSRERFSDKEESQSAVILALTSGLAERGEMPPVELLEWADRSAVELLKRQSSDAIGWTAVPAEGKPASENPWVIAAQPCQDGVNDQPFFYSLPKGEQRTGIYRSAAFEIPAKLSFWCAGHSGFPGKPLNGGNYVRLRDATTHAVLAESRPPRNDTAQRIDWDLAGATAGRGYVELVDGDTGDAYAWLAVGRFSLAGLNPSDTARKQQLAAEIVGKLKLSALKPQLATLVAAPSTDGAARAAIGQALVALDPDSRAAALVAALNDPSIPDANRAKMGYAITVDVDAEYLENLREVMKRAPSRLQTTIAETLAGDAAGADALLALVESGHAAPRLLLAPNVASKLGTLSDAKLSERVSAATAKLPPANETLDKLILERRLTFATTTPNLEKGQAVFTKHCAACHQVAGQGAVVGPQLDGIGNRGLERIIEDVLDPNRNVDVAFRTTTLRLEDGRVLSGLFRRAEGTQQVFADSQGKEFTVAKDEISQEQKTALSLMPANVPEIVPAEDFNDLVGWLLGQRQAEKK